MKVSFAIIAKHFRRFDELWNQIQSLSKKGPEWEVILVLDEDRDNKFSLPKYNSATKFGRELNGSFSRMRNFALDMCRGDWIFHIDTDELLPSFFVDHYEKTFWKTLEVSNYEIYGFPRINNFANEENPEKSLLFHNWPDYQFRLHKKLPGIRWSGDVHERLSWQGFPYRDTAFEPVSDFAIIHDKTIAEQHESDRLYKEKFGQTATLTLPS